MKNCLFIPDGKFASDDAAARKRKEIAEKLKRGQDVNITNTGEVVATNDPKAANENSLVVPAGKLAASFYWYERDPDLLNKERTIMQIYFPQFQLTKLDDGRLCWIGDLNPRGKDGGVWTIQAVYDHNHPHNNSYGGSIRVYSIKPALEDIMQEIEGNLPHLLKDEGGNYYMCTARMEDVDAGGNFVTTAAKSIGWAAKWTWMVEGWLNGELGDEVFGHGTF
jgi:hypothetical protein